MQANTVEKLEKIQSLFDSGKSHAEIAKELGYSKIESFYRYIYRYDDQLNYRKLYHKKNLTVVQPDVKQEEKKVIETPVKTKTRHYENQSKADSIIALIARGMDVKEVSRKKRFNGMQDMADYMKSKGYIWSSTEKNYIRKELEEKALESNNQSFDPVYLENDKTETDNIRGILNRGDECTCGCLDKYGDLLKMLDDNKDKLHKILMNDIESSLLPRYMLPGVITTKTFNMVEPLKELIIEFSQEKNIQQKEIFEIAMIEFLKNYGFKDEVKIRLGL